MEEAILLEAKGSTGQLELLKDRVRIRRKGIPAKGRGGDHDIPYSQLVSIELESGWGGGYIYFVVAGQEDEAGRKDKYQVNFGASQREQFEEIKRVIEQRIKDRQGSLEKLLQASESLRVRPQGRRYSHYVVWGCLILGCLIFILFSISAAYQVASGRLGNAVDKVVICAIILIIIKMLSTRAGELARQEQLRQEQARQEQLKREEVERQEREQREKLEAEQQQQREEARQEQLRREEAERQQQERLRWEEAKQAEEERREETARQEQLEREEDERQQRERRKRAKRAEEERRERVRRAEEERREEARRAEEERQRQINELLQRDEVMDHVNYMDGHQFERFMAELFRKQGYSVKQTPGSGDQGTDLLLDVDGRKVAVQLKRWSVPVGNKAVQETFAGMFYYEAREAWLITTSSFTKSAKAAAEKTRVRLIDGNELTDWMTSLIDEPIQASAEVKLVQEVATSSEPAYEQGQVKWFDHEKGYGFLVRPNGEELFVHHTEVESDLFALEAGVEVEYVVGRNDRGPNARSVRLMV